MHGALTPSFLLRWARIVSGCFLREERKHAGIPEPQTASPVMIRLVLNIEAPAGGTEEGARSAIDTGELNLIPEGGIEEVEGCITGNGCHVELRRHFPFRSLFQGLDLFEHGSGNRASIRHSGKKCFAFGRHRLKQITFTQIHQEGIQAGLVKWPRSHRGAKTGAARLVAGESNQDGRFPALDPPGVLDGGGVEVAVVQLECSGVAGANPPNHAG